MGKKKVFNKVSSDAFQKMAFGTGMLLSKFNPESPTVPDDADIICTTGEDITASCVASYKDMAEGIGNVPEGMAEMMELEGYTCSMSFTGKNITPEFMAMAIGPATVTGNKITPKSYIEATDFKSGVWLLIDLLSGGWAAVHLKNVLSSGGLSLKTAKGGVSDLSCELKGYYSIKNQDEVPMEFYVSTTAVSE